MRSTTTLSDGTKLRTSSQRRFVVFAISDDSIAGIYKRSDNLRTAQENYVRAARHFCRAVLVDTATGSAIADSANTIGGAR